MNQPISNGVKRVLVIGAGKRAQTAIIPALLGLSDEFEIAAVYARQIREIKVIGGIGERKFTTIDRLESVDFSSLDLIMVAVTLGSVPDVLRKLSRFNTRHIRIMLDTPVVRPRDILSLRLLRNFRKADVSEDSILLAPFLEAKREIGEIREVRFIHCGYRYHALAAAKMLTGNNRVSKIKNIYKNGKIIERHFIFPAGARGVIIEPRDYSIGEIRVIGERGEFNYSFADKSMQDLKNEALKKLISDESLAYSVLDGVYDRLAIALSEKLGVFRDLGFRRILGIILPWR